MQRRTLLKAAATSAQLSLLLAAGLAPRRLLAAWPTEAFHADQLRNAENLLFGGQPIEDSPMIEITAPDIAENGRNVPVEVSFELPGESASLSLLSDTNPYPLLARAQFTPEVATRLSLRVKLGATGHLIAIVETDGRLYRAKRPVKVTAGGCGG